MDMKNPNHPPRRGDLDSAEPMNRRIFLRAAAVGAAALAMPRSSSARQALCPDRTAEELIHELYTGLTEDQKNAAILPLDSAERLQFHNQALGRKIGQVYTRPQQEILGRILRALSSGEEGWRQISRDGTWDASKAFENCGANLFGDLSGKYTWVF